ncbi:hypothetical protein [Streptomyces sp. NPDC006551]|uniref:hypothetical protein n=1 Tax=Streptomyces sp. NPDC006551 TaxID=3157178 RepID=UPI0033B9D70E
MGTEGRRTVHDPQAEPHCPACGQSVGTAIKRHKVLGAWVPVWEARPCHNPDCELFGRKADGSRPTAAAPDDAEGAAGAGSGERSEATEGTATGGAEAASTQLTGKNGETGRSQAPG